MTKGRPQAKREAATALGVALLDHIVPELPYDHPDCKVFMDQLIETLCECPTVADIDKLRESIPRCMETRLAAAGQLPPVEASRKKQSQPGGVSTLGYHPGGALPTRDDPLE